MPIEVDYSHAEEVTPPEYSAGEEASTSGDYCSVCGVPLTYAGRGKHPTKCAQHKAGASKGPSGGSGGSGAKGGAASQGEWDMFTGLLLAASTYILGRWLSGGKGLFLTKPPELTEEQYEASTQYYAMRDDEVKPIAALVAKRITPTTFNKKYGKHVVNVVNYEEVGMALWEYGKRVRPAVVARVNAPKTPKTPKPVKAPTRRHLNSVGPPAADPTINHQEPTNGKEPSTNGSQRPLSNAEAVRLLRARSQDPDRPQGSG